MLVAMMLPVQIAPAVFVAIMIQFARADVGDQLRKIVPSDGMPGDLFGFAVSASSDFAVIGAHASDHNGFFSGSTYVFDLRTGEELLRLEADDGSQSAQLGRAVALYENIAIVGAPRTDDNGAQSGSAYLFDISTGRQIAKLLADDRAASDWFGEAVGISGVAAIVGAWRDDDNGDDSGSAYLFETLEGQQLAKLLPNDGAVGDHFGVSVDVSGSLAVVGARHDDDNGLGSGSAYVFDTVTGEQVSKLVAMDGATGDNFESSVAIAGNLVVVGAPSDDDNGDASGSAYLFDAFTGLQLAKLLPNDGANGDRFGVAVDMYETTVIVGAHRVDDRGTDAGGAYLFDASTGEQIAKILADDRAAFDSFGFAVALGGDRALVGAYQDDALGFDSGAAYLFSASSCPADLDGDNDADADDFFLYLDAFATGDTDICDLNNDADCDAEDFFAYLDLFAAGCE